MSLINVKSHIGPYIPNWIKYGIYYHNVLSGIYKYHALNNEEKKIHIQSLVLKTVCKAYNNTSFYNRLYKENNINPNYFKEVGDLKYLPIISKTDIITNVDELIIEGFNKDKLIQANTGGSTGNPLLLYRSKDEMAHEFAYLDFHLSKLFGGYSWVNKNKLILRGNTYKGEVIKQLGCNLIVSSQLISEDNIEYVVKKITEFKPSLIHAYPSSLMKLIDLLFTNDLKLNIPYVLTSSEVITQQQINLARRVLNSKHLDIYGNSEHSVLALNYSGSYEFDMNYAYTEFNHGKIISTKLLNSPMPLIRYDCGDIYLETKVLVNKEDERKLLSIGGRITEYIYDLDNNKLPIVSLIYGQHYDFFNAVSDFSLVHNICGSLIVEYISSDVLSDSCISNAQMIVNEITNNKLCISFVKVDSMRIKTNGKKASLVSVYDYD
ncbi:hypothetical protein [Aliivibrio sp. SR45-2]|uniref:hypothetical protein n=1 Tax=Aliivibrio sp. SR45-2 TaxID=2760931 RepID=UPI0015F978E3|nr:hypothetical protein [Aliivibrio sp. SR45-2]MBB1315958.1 hypothetical protein [Aliivibrio sp. SR45-2]